MRVVRFAGENVSPSDDGRLYDQIFSNGLFESTTIAAAGGSQINIGALYGIIRGREFTAEAQTIDATLPTGSGTATGTIYAEIDLSKEEPLSIKTALDPWTATDQNINVSGVVAQVKIGTYTANPTAVTAASYVAPSTPVSPLDKYAELKQKDTSLTNSITTLGNHLNTAEGNINENRSDIMDLSSDIMDLSGRVATAERDITTLNNGLTNMVKSVSGTTPSSSTDLVLAYPIGFTMNNCSIVNIEINFNGIWRNLSAMAGDPAYRVITSLRANGIYVYPTGSSAMSTAIRITLLRIV